MDLIRIGFLLGSLLGMFQSGCGQDEQPVPTHLLFGSIVSTTIEASGSWAYVELIASGGQGDSVSYSTSCQISGPACRYQLNFVEEGRYTVLAFIDMNDSAQPAALGPDSGDLTAQARPLILWDRTEMNFEDDLWRAVR